MPLYDYECNSCHHCFEQLAKGSKDPDAGVCPQCNATGASRKVSRFKVGGRGDLRETSEFHGCHTADAIHETGHKHGPGCGHT